LTTEFIPPRGIELGELAQKVRAVADLVDAVNIPELKASRAEAYAYRMSPFHVSLRIRELTGVETIFHLTPRDQNRSALHGTLLAAAEAQLSNVLAISGDRYSDAEQDLSRNVYDIRTTPELIQAIKSVENEFKTSFCVVVGTDPTVLYGTSHAERLTEEIGRLLERQDAGAEVAQTQPIFDSKFVEFVETAKAQGLKMPVLAGIIPLSDLSDSLRVEQRFRITIPRETKRRLSEAGPGAGFKIAAETCAELQRAGVAGFHIYPREQPEVVRNIAASLFG
jgi:5,10-methylenetetrahydrofolate reductase